MFGKDNLPILGILRGITQQHISTIIEVSERCKLEYIEITMNTKNAGSLIQEAVNQTGNKLKVGAGTVLNMNDLELALKSGAKFIVCPSVVEEVIIKCRALKIPVFPGALTPTEVHRAQDCGATMVKLFPASVFGPKYIKELKGPFDQLKIMAVGGVNEENIGQYFEMGADAVAFGASIFNLNWLEEKNTAEIESKLNELILAYLKYRQSMSL